MSISTVILAGGLGTRIGGDKALQLLQGRPLLDWVLETVQSQSDEVLISANSHPTSYMHHGCPVIADRIADHAGPLAGLHAAMMVAVGEWVASVPCDAPFLPRDLLVRLRAAVRNVKTEAAVAVTGGRRQPVVALYHRSLLQKLNGYLTEGGRTVAAWQDGLRLAEVLFADATDFINLNTARELALANRILNSGGTHGDIRRAIA